MKQWELINGEWRWDGKRQTATPAIHLHCSQFCGQSAQDATKCENRGCPLWGFRTGKSPYPRKMVHKQAKDASGRFSAVNNGEKSISIKSSSGVLKIPDDCEIIIRKKGE
jgi:hypothetical protein